MKAFKDAMAVFGAVCILVMFYLAGHLMRIHDDKTENPGKLIECTLTEQENQDETN